MQFTSVYAVSGCWKLSKVMFPNFAGRSMVNTGFSRKTMYLHISIMGLCLMVRSGQKALDIFCLISSGVS